MKILARGYLRAVALLYCVLPAAIAVILMTWETPGAQVTPVDARYRRCEELLKKEISLLTDKQLQVLKSCLQPLKQRQKEKGQSPEQVLAPIEQKAPLRIYGK